MTTTTKTNVTRAQFIAQARTCLGARFRHQGRTPEVGLDCVGLLLYTAHSLGLTDYDYTAYPRHPDPDELERHLNEMLEPIHVDEARPGDVYRFAFNGEAIHVGLATDVGVIHSYAIVRKVVEHGLDDKWRDMVIEAYKIPLLEDA
ncbi:hypothetical protein [Burkholderia pseudomallei]|uniref:hypothetical protein n=1 Tax=Burkholderia pseudomallei TaxID=28450 RepID=UPI000978318A|nr:hypothetical protein [Burkholderia pseudomallei]CAJ3486924.1 NlpC/P60 family phage cell wall peptidase [Burkholderia pseudomallei]CAJ4177055.1 NlpC/P60 family phage cell wall peptidase [Burkholderia pseudomallei]CAJ4618762.1 NlpC/P60 family phage cell wall peptidase [Burkholderia pseudomallei]CAJ5602084.1 NlpC/P60 family phage cell wall peptidase [Burkholderia pseudomallei]CAJ6078587.1 NlpC/P60 family phage cell wall peptidase [Burkholderia pseudomallei]